MPQPKKYRTDAERYRAYRQRKRDQEEALRRELALLGPSSASGKRGAMFLFGNADDALCQELLVLRREIDRRRKEANAGRIGEKWNPNIINADILTGLVDHIEKQLDLLKSPSVPGKRGAPFTLGQAALCYGLAELREEIIHRKQKTKTSPAATQRNPPAVQALEPFELLNYIEGELDRLMK